jgi:diguanylate cyclase (GGDEF)-like protein
VSDWIMPGLDGVDLCRQIRHHPGTGRGYTYIMLLTSLAEKQHFIRGMQAGADDYLRKPLDREELQVRLLAASRVTGLHTLLTEQKLELERLNRQLFEEGRRDPLTRIANRLCMQEDLARLQDAAQRYGHAFAVAICDIDAYKLYNDHYGHLAGDETLRRVAGCLSNHCRKSDTVYRYGGEEFLLLLPEQDVPGAVVAMERMREAIMALGLPHAKGPAGCVTISVGIACSASFGALDADGLLGRADAALYYAKQHGRNRVAVHRPESITLEGAARQPALVE